MEFHLDKDQIAKYQDWVKDTSIHKKCKLVEGMTAIGGAITFSFTMTGLGVIETVRCSICNNELDLTRYEEW